MTTTDAQKEAQSAYNERQKDRGYYQTRPWLPIELRDWHRLMVKRAREWKEHGVPMRLPKLPDDVRK